jgi:hypothetical protein
MTKRASQKITFAEMRAAGVRGRLIYCSDFRCSHWTAISGDRWPDDVRLSDIEPRFACQACGQHGADMRAILIGGRNSGRRFPLRPIMLFRADEIRRKEPLH